MDSNLILNTMKQLQTVTWDGNLASKAARDWLVDRGWAVRLPDGYQVLSEEGIKASVTLLILKDG